jgi:hypothetical protein
MSENGYSIFRPDALRRYEQSRDQAVLPRFISPRTFLAIWLLFGLLATAGVTAWFARVPVYAGGPAVAAQRPGPGQQAPGDVVAIAFLPAESRAALHAGQMIFLDLNGAGARVRRTISAVEPEVLSPGAVRGRFALDPATASAITEPVVLVSVDPAPVPPGLPASAFAGSVYRAEVQVGSRRLLTLVPLIGSLLGG